MSEKKNKDTCIDGKLDIIIEKNKDGARAMKKIIEAISKEKEKAHHKPNKRN